MLYPLGYRGGCASLSDGADAPKPVFADPAVRAVFVVSVGSGR
ncbi:MAG: hypothetical protein JWQ90_170 [Hydrocarboniphaga sp.]|nr:hypothetical protein [Hydrocarboniphaga sp.]